MRRARLPPLMPARPSDRAPTGTGATFDSNRAACSRQKRRQVASACANCRRRKEKCDDRRPACGACARRGVACTKGGDDGDDDSAVARTTSAATTGMLKSRNAALLRENGQLRDLLAALGNMSPARGQDLLARIRAADADDPIRAL
ncbi:hypothetical protein E4U41_001236, partial [Claviceps citrina]